MAQKEVAVETATIAIGKKARVRTTEIKIPQVRKRFCHLSERCWRTFAFTTALSKERVTSRTTSSDATKKACTPPHHQIATSPSTVAIVGARNAENLCSLMAF